MGCCCSCLKKNNNIIFTKEFPYTHYEIQQLLKNNIVIEKGAHRYSAIKTKYITFQIYEF